MTTHTHDNRLGMVRNRLKLRGYTVSEIGEGKFGGRVFTIEQGPDGRPVAVDVTDLATPNGQPSDIRWGASGFDDLALTPDQLVGRIVEALEALP